MRVGSPEKSWDWLRSRFRLLVHLLGLVLLGIIVWWGGPEAWRELSQGQPRPIMIAFLLTGIANMLSAVRLRLVVRTASPKTNLPWRRIYYLTMLANTAGLILPRSVSTVGGKSVGLKALGVPVRRSVSTVFVDNAFDLFFLTPLVVPAILYLREQISGKVFWLLAAVLSLALSAVLWWALDERRLNRLALWFGRQGRLRMVEQGLRLLPGRFVSFQLLLLTILLNGLLALRFYFIGTAVNLDYDWLLYLAAFPLTQLSLVFGGLGIFDASWYGVLLLSGWQDQEALTFVIAQRAYVFIYILVWTGLSYLLSIPVGGGPTLKEQHE